MPVVIADIEVFNKIQAIYSSIYHVNLRFLSTFEISEISLKFNLAVNQVI